MKELSAVDLFLLNLVDTTPRADHILLSGSLGTLLKSNKVVQIH